MGRRARKNKRRVRRVCPKCGKQCHLTKHHILPKRFFGPNNKIFLICRDCHDELEKFIPKYDKLNPHQYFQVLRWFLTEWKGPYK